MSAWALPWWQLGCTKSMQASPRTLERVPRTKVVLRLSLSELSRVSCRQLEALSGLVLGQALEAQSK